MSKTTKANDIDDLLGDTPAPKKGKPAAKAAPAAKAEKPAATKATKAKAPAAEEAAPAEKAPRTREPVVFADGEKEALMKRVPKLLKNPISSKDLAAKMEVSTRKLRRVLYSCERAGSIVLTPGASRTDGMTVSAAPAA